MTLKRGALYLLVLFASPVILANEWSGNVSVEQKFFSTNATVAQQFNQYSSAAVQLEWFHDWDRGKQSLVFSPFARVDQHDKERTHADIRELMWMSVFEQSELRIGIGKVFWGVTESQHLVDIINQTDLVENSDGEDKLGQPMINYSMIRDWGVVDVFVLPYFRERTFPGVNGRLRTLLLVDTSNPEYESSSKNNHIDYALRWVHSVGNWDLGLSYFTGTNREPSYRQVGTVLRPVYNQLTQVGADVQATIDSWLWKLELVQRQDKTENYVAATGGFEYTINGIFDSDADLGIVLEYLYDNRTSTTVPFDDDTMMGLRWTANDEQDTTLLFGVIADNKNSNRLYSLEGSRRLGENWKLNIEARLFEGIQNVNDPLYSLRNDDFIQIDLAYYF